MRIGEVYFRVLYLKGVAGEVYETHIFESRILTSHDVDQGVRQWFSEILESYILECWVT